MINLQTSDGDPIAINPRYIVSYRPVPLNPANCFIHIEGRKNEIEVSQSFNYVDSKIYAATLAMRKIIGDVG